VALLLAKAGVGDLLLIDDDMLKWENIGRHLLGAESVGRNKAEVLAEFISRQLPHHRIDFEPRGWEELHTAAPAKLEGVDLIISTTGEWASDAALNLLARTSLRFPPVLFGWTEPHGTAGHALLVSDTGGCLSCGFDELGHFAQRVTHWPDNAKTLSRGAACGNFYQPYGSIDVAPLKAVIAERALDSLLHRQTSSYWSAWGGCLHRLRELDGEFMPAWRDKLQADTGGMQVISSKWPINPSCELCR
jgi:molybdopterin/thiamine biosynthesis adenylyltransferase